MPMEKMPCTPDLLPEQVHVCLADKAEMPEECIKWNKKDDRPQQQLDDAIARVEICKWLAYDQAENGRYQEYLYQNTPWKDG